MLWRMLAMEEQARGMVRKRDEGIFAEVLGCYVRDELGMRGWIGGV
jgi:hypothetical protein